MSAELVVHPGQRELTAVQREAVQAFWSRNATTAAQVAQDRAARRLARVVETVRKNWSKHAAIVEAQLAACATLRLQGVSQSIALFAVGGSGSGKSTTLGMFRPTDRQALTDYRTGLAPLIDEQDKFTIPAFLSHYSEKKAEDLEAGALARTLKHRVMLTSELGPTFRGPRATLDTTFANLAQILDGEGIRASSGAHGTLGEKGDFSFVWLGATTPPRIETWTTMASLGTRLLFYRIAKDAGTCPEELYKPAQEECREQVGAFLEDFFPRSEEGVRITRSEPWPDLDPIRKEIRALADLCALGQTQRTGNLSEDEQVRPSAGHFRQRLMILACGRALLYGRKALSTDDLPMIRRIVESSMPGARGPVLLAIMDGARTVDEIAATGGLSVSFVSKVLSGLEQAGVVRKTGGQSTGGRSADRWALQLENENTW